MYNWEGESYRKVNKPLIVVGVLLVCLAIGFFFYYSNATSAISTANSLISNLRNQNTATVSQSNLMGDQLTAANSQITTLKSQLAADESQISTIQGQLSTTAAGLASTQNQLNTANSQVSSLQGQLGNASSQATSLQGQLTSANTQISTLQSQVNSLNAQIQTLQTTINNNQSSTSTQLISGLNITQNPGQQSLLTSFNATTSGYLNVTGYSSSVTGYIRTINTNYGASTNYTLGTASSTVMIPIQTGTVSIYFGNSDATGTITATINNITWVSNSTSATTSTQIASGLTINQNFSQQSFVTSFIASTAGSLTITGSSTSNTGYVRTINSTYGASTNYSMNPTASTITIPVEPGTVSIYFGNTDTSGTISATFSTVVYSHS
jgi:peptidoglycan hydrolase CwlO-like protein